MALYKKNPLKQILKIDSPVNIASNNIIQLFETSHISIQYFAK